MDIDRIKKDFERAQNQTPDEAMQEYHTNKVLPRPERKIDPETVKNIISSLDSRGAWVQEIRIPDYIDVVNNPRRTLQGIQTRTFIRNMQTMTDYLRNIKD